MTPTRRIDSNIIGFLKYFYNLSSRELSDALSQELTKLEAPM